MGRGRGKGRRQNACDDAESGEEERIPTSKRRVRPQRPMKNDEDGDTEMMYDDADNAKSTITDKDTIEQTDSDAKKRKNSREFKEDSSMGEDQKDSGAKPSTLTDDSVKSVGFRQIGSRRKGKPRRAAEVGVECN